MNKKTLQETAAQFLNVRGIEFSEPIRLGNTNGSKQKIIFTDPLSLDPNVAVVEPGIIRVWVDIETGEITLIYDM